MENALIEIKKTLKSNNDSIVKNLTKMYGSLNRLKEEGAKTGLVLAWEQTGEQTGFKFVCVMKLAFASSDEGRTFLRIRILLEVQHTGLYSGGEKIEITAESILKQFSDGERTAHGIQDWKSGPSGICG